MGVFRRLFDHASRITLSVVVLDAIAPTVATPFDTREKRANLLGVARPWMRDKFPVATPDEEWRMSSGNTTGQNALTPVAGGFQIAWARGHNKLIGGGTS